MMATIALFAQPGDAGSAGTGTEAEGQAEVSVHPVSPLAPATLVPFGLLMGSRSCWECCKTAQPLLHIPSSRDAPAIMVCPHGIACARLSSSLWLEGVSAAGCLAVQRPQPLSSALGGGQQGGCVMVKSGSQCRGWKEASCLLQDYSGQPGWEKESAQGSRLMVKTGPLLLYFLLIWELPKIGPPCSSVPAGINWILMSC